MNKNKDTIENVSPNTEIVVKNVNISEMLNKYKLKSKLMMQKEANINVKSKHYMTMSRCFDKF